MGVRLSLLLVMVFCAAPVQAMEVRDVQGGCEPSMAHKLVRQSSAKLERCRATGQVMIHVAPDGRVEHVSSDVDARPCLTARTDAWRFKMKEARRCTLQLWTDAAAKLTKANQEAFARPQPPAASQAGAPPSPVAARPTLAKPPAPVTSNLPVVQPETEKDAPKVAVKAKPAKVDKAAARREALKAKKAKHAEAIAAKKAKRAGAIAAKKAKRSEAIAAKKAKAAEKHGAHAAKPHLSKAEKAKAKREAAAAKKVAKAQKKAAHKHPHKKPKKKLK